MGDKPKAAAPVLYPRQELIDNAYSIFKVQPEVVQAALRDNPALMLDLDSVRSAVQAFLQARPY